MAQEGIAKIGQAATNLRGMFNKMSTQVLGSKDDEASQDQYNNGGPQAHGGQMAGNPGASSKFGDALNFSDDENDSPELPRKVVQDDLLMDRMESMQRNVPSS